LKISFPSNDKLSLFENSDPSVFLVFRLSICIWHRMWMWLGRFLLIVGRRNSRNGSLVVLCFRCSLNSLLGILCLCWRERRLGWLFRIWSFGGEVRFRRWGGCLGNTRLRGLCRWERRCRRCSYYHFLKHTSFQQVNDLNRTTSYNYDQYTILIY